MIEKENKAKKLFVSRLILTMKSTDDMDNIKQCCEMIISTIDKIVDLRSRDDENIVGGKL